MSFPFSLSSGLAPPIVPTIPNLGCLLSYTGNNTIQTARYIDPITQDFVVGNNGQLLGMNYIDQEVQLALNTQFNSSVLSGFGQNFLSPKVVANDPVALTNQMTSLVQQCLQYQISNNSITVGAITASQISSGVVVVQFNYVNNVINQNISYSFLVQ